LARLRSSLKEIDKRGARFLLSYASVGEARQMSLEWHRRTVTVTRQVAAFAGSRRAVHELLAMNYELSR
jgi:hypothetical protein